MDSIAQNHLDYLLTLSLEGALSVEQTEELNRLISGQNETMAYCIDFLRMVAYLRKAKGQLGGAKGCLSPLDGPEMLGEVMERDEQVRGREAARQAEVRREEIRKAAEMALERFKEQEHRRQEELAQRRYLARRRQLAVGVFAAVALIVMGLSAWFVNRSLEPDADPVVELAALPVPVAPPVVAVISRTSETRWDRTDVSPTVGTDLTAGPIVLDEGFMEITFPSGARLIIAAPAEVNLVDERRVRLDRGVLTAHVPEEARGFEVETPSVRVTDLGTEFALAIDANGAVDVHVLDGWIAASFGDDEAQRLVKALHQDSAMRFDARAGTMRSIAIDADRFARTWDDVLYKPRVDGDIRFQWSMPVLPDQNIPKHDDFARLFLERSDVHIRREVTTNISTPGCYEFFEGLSASVPTGVRVDSYLLHWAPRSDVGRQRVIEGRLTFRRPILGVMVTAKVLTTGDRLFGPSGTAYAQDRPGRGLESTSDRQYADTVVLSPDRRMLEVKLRALGVDQVRILVAAPLMEER